MDNWYDARPNDITQFQIDQFHLFFDLSRKLFQFRVIQFFLWEKLCIFITDLDLILFIYWEILLPFPLQKEFSYWRFDKWNWFVIVLWSIKATNIGVNFRKWILFSDFYDELWLFVDKSPSYTYQHNKVLWNKFTSFACEEWKIFWITKLNFDKYSPMVDSNERLHSNEHLLNCFLIIKLARN